jgi:hypothetical protein
MLRRLKSILNLLTRKMDMDKRHGANANKQMRQYTNAAATLKQLAECLQ